MSTRWRNAAKRTKLLAATAVAVALAIPAGLASADEPAPTPTGDRSTTADQDTQAANIAWSGVRSSRYGIDPFPEPEGWGTAIDEMSGYFDGSQPVALWLVGEIEFDGENSGQHFNFPNPGGDWDPTIRFEEEDQNEAFLDYFDEHGISVYLQVESGHSDMNDLIDIVDAAYGDHPSVIGFGVDVEWFHAEDDCDCNVPATDDDVAGWNDKVKEVNPDWRLFVKHYDIDQLPPNYREDVVFICDSEQNGDYESFKSTMIDFAEAFAPADVMFQIGYPSDKEWWSEVGEPIPQTIGEDLAADAPQENVGIVWVDFSLRDVLPTE